MKIQDIRIGQKLQLSNFHGLAEWRGEEVTIVGLKINGDDSENITVLDQYDNEYDGFTSNDFIDA